MSDDIYHKLSCKSITNFCQYEGCGNPTSNPRFCNLSCCNKENARKQKIAKKLSLELKEQEYLKNPKKCLECEGVIKFGSEPAARFCNHSCSAKYTNRLRLPESRIKQKSNAAKTWEEKLISNKFENWPVTKISWHTCPITGLPYHNRSPSGGRRQQSPYAKDIKQIYYDLCKFKFNVTTIPAMFDLNLLSQFGWYTCPGKKRAKDLKNTNGVSRDHLYSVSSGLRNKIHPFILSHPMNCKLVLHSDNKHKHTKCDITIDELITKILTFDNNIHRFKHHDVVVNLIQEGKVYITDFESLRCLV